MFYNKCYVFSGDKLLFISLSMKQTKTGIFIMKTILLKDLWFEKCENTKKNHFWISKYLNNRILDVVRLFPVIHKLVYCV